PRQPLPSFPTRRSSDLRSLPQPKVLKPQLRKRAAGSCVASDPAETPCTARAKKGRSSGSISHHCPAWVRPKRKKPGVPRRLSCRSEEHTSELQSRENLV